MTLSYYGLQEGRNINRHYYTLEEIDREMRPVVKN